MSLVQPLPEGPLDIVGDIHGEFDALCALLGHLGYDAEGRHPQGRHLVFVGDFCDRGPNSPAVFALAKRLIASGRAVAVLGNHEINLLRHDPKDGSGWFFDEREQRDQDKYAPFARPDNAARQEILALISTLPVALERKDLRVVHAAWVEKPVQSARQLPMGDVRRAYDQWEQLAHHHAQSTDLAARLHAELSKWGHDLEDRHHPPPFLHAQAEHESNKQMFNPLKVLTSGVERKGRAPFFASGKWRFVERVGWWDDYAETIPVVVGHYWRRASPVDRAALGKGDPDLFGDIEPLRWHGKHGNVFCVDFSVGGRWAERKKGAAPGNDYKLAALRWPEKTLQFDDDQQALTEGFAARTS